MGKRRAIAAPKHPSFLAGLAPSLILLAAWSAMTVVTNPIGDFPLNDDWAFGRPVKTLLEEGRVEFTGWMSMTLIAQVLWGALFGWPFGFSFTALRISTLTLGFVGIWSTYGLLREAGADRRTATFGALLVAVCPLYFALSHTFMTDVPFFAVGMLALWLFARGLRRDRAVEWVAAVGLMCIAVLIRQFGFALAVTFAFGLAVRYGRTRRSIALATIPIIASALCYGAFMMWLKSGPGVPELYGAQYPSPASLFTLDFWFRAAFNLATIPLYVGLFLGPWLLFLPSPPITLRGSAAWQAAATFLMGAIVELVLSVTAIDTVVPRLMPLRGNVFINFGIGPALLHDTYFLNLPNHPRAPLWIWTLVTLASLVGAVRLFRYAGLNFAGLPAVFRRADSLHHEWFHVVIAVCATLYCLLLLIAPRFDRYVIFLLPLVMILVARVQRASPGSLNSSNPAAARRVAIAWLGLLLFGWFSIAGTHDYLAWNRVRWNTLRQLLADGTITSKTIDAGVEFHGWYDYRDRHLAEVGKSWWWVEDDGYILTLGPVSGYQNIREYPYSRWLPGPEGRLYLMRRRTKS
ncbi:MAG: glycosyltransferase family 39 protein [Candidatus Hydrogenedentes bacterium]|nr:glycosyltransferase family 39 protein [Candidatus Hydrogenedentota bacterium]